MLDPYRDSLAFEWHTGKWERAKYEATQPIEGPNRVVVAQIQSNSIGERSTLLSTSDATSIQTTYEAGGMDDAATISLLRGMRPRNPKSAQRVQPP